MEGTRRLASRGVDRAGGPAKFRPGGPLQILRQQESAVGCLFWLVTFTPCLSACRASTLRFGCSKGERTDTYATLLSDPSNFSLFSHFIFAFLFAKQPPPRCLVYVETVSIVSTSFVFSSLFFPLSLIIEGRIYLDFSNDV